MLPDKYASASFRVVYDPCPDPILVDYPLSTPEVFYGLRFHSFVVGTVIQDVNTGLQHTVVRTVQNGLGLAPPHPRINRRAYIEAEQEAAYDPVSASVTAPDDSYLDEDLDET